MCQNPFSRTALDRRRLLKAGGAGVSALLLASLGGVPAPTRAREAQGGEGLPARTPLLIRGAHVLSMDPKVGELPQGDVRVRDGRIEAVGESLDAQGAELIDGSGMILIPGLVDTHWHMWNSLARSFVPTPDGADFGAAMPKISGAYTPDLSYLAVRLSAAEALDGGITTVHNWAHNLRDAAFADAEWQALQASGLRGRFSYGYPQTLAKDRTMAFDDALRLCERVEAEPAWQFGLALRGPERTEEAVWRREWAFAREHGLPLTTHIGVSRTLQQQRAIRQLAQDGLLGPDVQLVHCTHASEEDCRLIAEAGSPVSLSPWTEMRVGYGLPPILRLHRAGVLISLSVDNTPLAGNADFFSIMRSCINLASGMAEDSLALSPRQVLEWATLGGAKDLGLADQIGSITPGKRADLALIDARQLNTAPLTDAAHIVTQSAQPDDVTLVVADGRVMKRDGRLVGLDDRALISDVERGWAALRARSGL